VTVRIMPAIRRLSMDVRRAAIQAAQSSLAVQADRARLEEILEQASVPPRLWADAVEPISALPSPCIGL
jgi:hypothetical protein